MTTTHEKMRAVDAVALYVHFPFFSATGITTRASSKKSFTPLSFGTADEWVQRKDIMRKITGNPLLFESVWHPSPPKEGVGRLFSLPYTQARRH